MEWQLDHVFFATAQPEAVERDLADFGLNFTVRRTHTGQGTANACAPFDNAFFEILRARDTREIRSEPVRPLGFDERIRWRTTGACPVGLCFRPAASGGADTPWPFDTWDYLPPYNAGGGGIPIVTPPGCFTDPLVFISHHPGPAASGVEHRGANRALTRVTLGTSVTGQPQSTGVKWFAENALFSLSQGDEPILTLEWDHGKEDSDHRISAAPIAIHW